MSGIQVDRRGFVLGGAAVAGATLCAGPLRVLARTMQDADGELFIGRCAGSEAWTALDATSLSARLGDGLVFTAGADAPADRLSTTRVLLAGASVRDVDRIRVRLAFPKDRWFEPMRAERAESPAGVACTVPTASGSLMIEVTTQGADGKETVRRAEVPAGRGAYAVGAGSAGASWRIRGTNGTLETDAAWCVLVALDSPAGAKQEGGR